MKNENICKYAVDGWSNYTSCGVFFSFDPEEEGFIFCPFCGKKIENDIRKENTS